MKLGAFSISLNVKDINVSYAFYQKLGFEKFAGHIEQKWLILKNGESLIGLFEGMLEKNMMTFNPGWDTSAQKLEAFDDVRDIQAKLKEQGVELTSESIDSPEGPGNFMTVDPDGNPILIDQHR